MKRQHCNAIFALAGAGVMWGLGVPLSKVALTGVGVGWLTFARFAVAAPLLAFAGRCGLRQAVRPAVVVSGAVGFGAALLLQNAGLQRTSVTHAALLVGAVPILVALIGTAMGSAATRPRVWAGNAVALAGIGFVASTGGTGASAGGDMLVFGSAILSAAFIAVSPRLLAAHDAAALTAVQFAAGALVALTAAVLFGGAPPRRVAAAPLLALGALSVSTPLPFWLFAFGQARVPAEVAGAFVNLEPVVGAAAGWLAFHETATVAQVLGALAVLAGIALSTGIPGRAHRALPAAASADGSDDGRPPLVRRGTARVAGPDARRRAGVLTFRAARAGHSGQRRAHTSGSARDAAGHRPSGRDVPRRASGHGAREHRTDRPAGEFDRL